MQYSTNYNLNLVEGTDIVNPLVIDKPNYIAIDAQMKLNEDAGVGTATEIKTGTVHALTRANGNNNTFRFVSTSVFNSGDTFTVDGVSVTALLPSGEALPHAAYAIGCNVLCILTSTELTVFTAKTTANDSARLNGELASFYTDSANIGYDNTLSGLTATDVQGAVDEVNGKLIFETAKAGCTTAQKVVDNYVKYLSEGLINICNVFRPSSIVLSGGIANQGDYLINKVVAYLEKEHYGYLPEFKVNIKIASLGYNSGIIGAASLLY